MRHTSTPTQDLENKTTKTQPSQLARTNNPNDKVLISLTYSSPTLPHRKSRGSFANLSVEAEVGHLSSDIKDP